MTTFKHGHAKVGKKTSAYQSWRNMINRCNNKNHKSYHYYGGKGIKICERWQDFSNFLSDMGEPAIGQSLDRIDNDFDYGPSNCKWSTRAEQNRNMSTNKMIPFNGTIKCLAEWAEEVGMRPGALGWRIKNGWSVADALTIAVRRRKKDAALATKNPT